MLSYFFYALIGVLPCLAWLAFYLKRDRHPEPKKEILVVFFLGALITLPAVFLEISLIPFLKGLGIAIILSEIMVNVIGIAFIEESLKYFVVWFKEQSVNKNSQLDEPVDLMIYMIVSALGFAAVENVLFLIPFVQAELAIYASIFRSLTAILLHTLCSGTVGYFMALSVCHPKKRRFLVFQGLAAASLLHGFYNLSIMKSEEEKLYLLTTLAVLAGLAIFLHLGFRKIKKIKSVCDIKII